MRIEAIISKGALTEKQRELARTIFRKYFGPEEQEWDSRIEAERFAALYEELVA